MFEFTDKYDKIKEEELSLVIIEKAPSTEEMIPYYYYDIIRNSDAQVVGRISIRIGHNFHSYYNGHIGYEIFEKYRGNHLAYKACRMVLAVAKFHGMKYLYLTCADSNIASFKTIEKLDAELIEVTEVPKQYFAWYEGMEMQRIYKMELRNNIT